MVSTRKFLYNAMLPRYGITYPSDFIKKQKQKQIIQCNITPKNSL